MHPFAGWFGNRRSSGVRAARWVVIDCETSGLDPARDRLLSVGAVSVRAGRIEAGPGYGAVLRQQSPSDAANILIHGIGGEAQALGQAAREALDGLGAFLGDSVPVAFHAPFDAQVLHRAMKAVKLESPRRWLDLARVAPALFPKSHSSRTVPRALDDWLEKFEIECDARHDALGDAYATAQLLLVLLAEAERQGAGTVDEVLRLERSGRWLPGAG